MKPTQRLLALLCVCCLGKWMLADEYRDSVHAWRAEHEEKFKSPTGWLALTGHYWLMPGDNTFGPSESDRIRLPADAAENTRGVIHVGEKQITFEVQSGAGLELNDQLVQSGTLKLTAGQLETDSPDKLTLGKRLSLQLVRRAGKLAIRVRDSQSPLIVKFHGKPWFEVDPKYRVKATYKPFAQPKPIKIINVKGDEVETMFAGQIEFELAGQKQTLDAIFEEPDNLFIIFRDNTCGKTSYGAGRFVDVTLPKTEGELIDLDFNKTYSPPCAWSPHTLCPIPPKQNHLDVAIEAGEKYQQK